MPADNPRAASLLDAVHAALQQRNYSALAELSRALEQELAHPATPLTGAALAIIHQKAQRNAATLLAVQRGIRSALRRIAEVKSASTGLVTYDLNGKRLQNAGGTGLAARF